MSAAYIAVIYDRRTRRDVGVLVAETDADLLIGARMQDEQAFGYILLPIAEYMATVGGKRNVPNIHDIRPALAALIGSP